MVTLILICDVGGVVLILLVAHVETLLKHLVLTVDYLGQFVDGIDCKVDLFAVGLRLGEDLLGLLLLILIECGGVLLVGENDDGLRDDCRRLLILCCLKEALQVSDSVIACGAERVLLTGAVGAAPLRPCRHLVFRGRSLPNVVLVGGGFS